jgi:cytochrome c556
MKALLKICVAACVMAAVTATAQTTPAESEQQAQQAAERRQAVMTLISWTMAPIGAMLRQDIPFDASLAKNQADRMEQLFSMLPELFRVDTSGFDTETRALDAIWSNWDDFVRAANHTTGAARMASGAAMTGNQQAVMQALGSLNCGGCHDPFRD